MSTRVKQIKQLQQILTTLLITNEKFLSLIDKETDKEFKKLLVTLLSAYALTNYSFSKCLIEKLPKSLKSDIIDMKFKDLMKPLEDEFNKNEK